MGRYREEAGTEPGEFRPAQVVMLDIAFAYLSWILKFAVSLSLRTTTTTTSTRYDNDAHERRWKEVPSSSCLNALAGISLSSTHYRSVMSFLYVWARYWDWVRFVGSVRWNDSEKFFSVVRIQKTLRGTISWSRLNEHVTIMKMFVSCWWREVDHGGLFSDFPP